MKRKGIPNAIRIHKVKDKQSHEWLYSQILLYHPFQNEDVDLKQTRENKKACEDLFLYPATLASISANKDDIRNSYVIKVRQKIMPFIEDVEEAREKVAKLSNEIIAEQIDAKIAQDNDDCNQEGAEIHPDFATIHPDFFFEGDLPSRPAVSSYRKVDLWDKKTIRSQICKLDGHQ